MDKKKICDRLEYFWMYYKLPFLAALVVLLLAVYFCTAVLTEKETALSVMLVDCYSEAEGEEMGKDFLEKEGLDGKIYQVQVQNQLMFQDSDSGNYAMTSLSRFLADIGSEKLDVCAMLEEDFLKYDSSGTWADLREYLDPEELERLSDITITAADGRVIGIRAEGLPVMERYGCYENGAAGIGIIYNTPHRELAAAYLLYAAERRNS